MAFPGRALVVACVALVQLARAGEETDSAPTVEANDAAANAVDRAVERGLLWLAMHQESCGGWIGDSGHKQGDDYVVYQSADVTRSRNGAQMGVSALAGLAFLADGQMPDRGKYAESLDRLITYVISRQNEFGYFEDGGSRMYSHSFATLFLAEAYGMCPKRQDEVGRALQLAVEFTQEAQNENGGWRYQPFTVEDDLSVTVCQVQALRAARDAGVPVSASCIDRVVDFVRDSRIEGGRLEGAFYYKIHGRSARTKTSFTVNAAAVTTLHSAGLYDEREYGAALDYVAEEYDDLSRSYPDHYYFWYGNYYAVQAMHMEGGKTWERYWRRLRDDLLARQQPKGNWVNDTGPGNTFATAVACLLLMVRDQWLPIFQR
jgi:squalene cyclase